MRQLMQQGKWDEIFQQKEASNAKVLLDHARWVAEEVQMAKQLLFHFMLQYSIPSEFTDPANTEAVLAMFYNRWRRHKEELDRITPFVDPHFSRKRTRRQRDT